MHYEVAKHVKNKRKMIDVTQFHIEIKQTNNQIFYANTSTISFTDNFDFKDILEPNIKNPFEVKLDSFEVINLKISITVKQKPFGQTRVQ